MRALFFGVKSVRANASEKSIINGYVKTQFPHWVEVRKLPVLPERKWRNRRHEARRGR
jgi:hypothetical protein